jgi:hypothetical protein
VYPKDYGLNYVSVHRNRICEIELGLKGHQLQQLVSVMQEQFPALIHLKLACCLSCHSATALSDGFLGGSAPRLQTLKLYFIPFPALPTLLLSATDLVDLILEGIPQSGYIPPEAIVTGLAMSANLTILKIRFNSLLSQKSRFPPPPTPSILPSLTYFEFKGTREYLVALLACIDAPLLDTIHITAFNLIYPIPQLARFLERTTRFEALNETIVEFDDDDFRVEFPPPTPEPTIFKKSSLRILCGKSDWGLPSMAKVFTLILPSIYRVENLCIYRPRYLPLEREDEVENSQWLEIFRLFRTVKNLYVTKEFARYIFPSLKKLVGERVADVLPALRIFFWNGSRRPPGGNLSTGRKPLGRLLPHDSSQVTP